MTVREGYALEFKRKVALFAKQHTNWPNTEVGAKFGIPSEYVRRWVNLLDSGRLEERTEGSQPQGIPEVETPLADQDFIKYVVEGLDGNHDSEQQAKEAAMRAILDGKIEAVVIKRLTYRSEVVFSLVQAR